MASVCPGSAFARAGNQISCAKRNGDNKNVKTLILLIGWCILFVLSWPVALLALLLFPVVWLISLPLRLIGITLDALFAFVRALLFLPARILGSARSQSRA